MEKMLYKFIDERKREHEEMRAFIYDLQTTSEILFKERNNSLIELRFGVQELLKVINNTPTIDYEAKGVTTSGGKTMTQDAQNNNDSVHIEEPHGINQDKPVESDEVLTNDQSQEASEPVAQPSNKTQTPPIPFPRRLRKQKEEAQQRKFLENLKQLHINLPFIEALVQIPKYAKYLKSLLTNKSRLEEACTGTMNEWCPAVLLSKLPSNEKDLMSIRHIDPVNTPYSKEQDTNGTYRVKNKHIYSASANEIDEKKPELEKISEEEENSLLQVLEKLKEAEDLVVDHLSKTYFWEEPYEFKLCADNIMRRCVAGSEILEFLAHCHSGPTGGHHSANVTGKKVYEFRFYWPNVFKDANEYVRRCDACQRSRNISLRNEMPQNNIQISLWESMPITLEIEHMAHWTLKKCNMDLTLASESRLMQLNELAKLRDIAYENTRIYKERTKKWHDSRLRGDKDFKVGDKVLLYNSSLKMYHRKHKSKWSGPNIVKIVYPHGDIEITDRDGFSFKVNGQRLKKYHGGDIDKEDDEQVNMVNPSCETYGGPHHYSEYQAAGGFTQGDVYAATRNYNMGANQMTKIKKAFNERPQGVLPSNTIPNPREDIKVITTRSGMTLAGPSVPPPPPPPHSSSSSSSSSSSEVERDQKPTIDQVHISSSESTARVPSPIVQPSPASKSNEIPERNPHRPPIPYPSKLNKDKLLDISGIQIHKFLQMFNKLYFNISFAKALAQIPNDLEECMAQAALGANINLMPLFVWKKLMLPELIPTRMTLELANRPVAYPAGIAKDVFVQVGKFTFPADFVVVDYDVDPRVSLILGRPFLGMARALVDVYGEELTLRVERDILLLEKLLNIDSTKYPPPQELNNDSEGDILFLEKLLEDEPFEAKKSEINPIIREPFDTFLMGYTEIKFNPFKDIDDPVPIPRVSEKPLDSLDSTSETFKMTIINPLVDFDSEFSLNLDDLIFDIQNEESDESEIKTIM
nr:hypothetical protein [Tanacetum cinerariifolium]